MQICLQESSKFHINQLIFSVYKNILGFFCELKHDIKFDIEKNHK